MGNSYTDKELEYLKQVREQASSSEEEEVVNFSTDVGGDSVRVPPPPTIEDEEEDPASISFNSQVSQEDINNFARASVGSPEKEEDSKDAVEVIESSKEGFTGVKQRNCQKCGWDLSAAVVGKISDEDKHEFIRSILGERRFEKEFKYLGNKVKIRLRSMTGEEEECIKNKLMEEIDSGVIKTTAETMQHRTNYRLAYCLSLIKLPDVTKKYEFVTAESIQERVNEINVHPTSIKAITLHALKEFEELYTTLISRTYDSDFWVGLEDSNS